MATAASFFFADMQPMARRPMLDAFNTAVRPMLPSAPMPAGAWAMGDVYQGVDLDLLFGDAPLLPLDVFDHDMATPLCSGPTSPASNFEPSPLLPEPTFASLLPAVPAFQHMLVKPEPADTEAPESASEEEQSADTVLTTTRSGRMVRQVRYTELTEITALDLEPAPPRRRSSGGVSAPTSRRRSSSYMAVKRDSHNVSERFRRAELKTSLDELRALVPNVKDDSRGHTGTILQETIAYIRLLEDEDRQLLAQIAEQRALLQQAL